MITGWSIRTRLAVWNTCMTIVVMLMFGAAAYWVTARTLLARTDDVLDFEFRETAELLHDDEDDLGESGNDQADVPQAFLESFLLRITDSRGVIVMESPRLKGHVVPFPAEAKSSIANLTEEIPGLGRHRVVAGPIKNGAGDGIALIAVSLADYDRELADFRNSLLYVLPIAIVAAAAGGYWAAGRALRPVHVMTTSAREISEHNLRQRLEIVNEHDELGRLATALNGVFDRLADALDATRRFTADASHELMTPLATIRTEAEVALQSPRSPEHHAEVLRSIVEEVSRLTRLAERLLTLARADSLTLGAQGMSASVAEVADDALDRIGPIAAREGLQIHREKIPNGRVAIDPELLTQVIDNLLDNAVKYRKANGHVWIRGRRESESIVIEIADDGIGIPAEAVPQVFERFFRVNASRSRKQGGVGLGLSIARALVEAAGGRIEVASEIGKGTTFSLRLPLLNEK